MAQGLGIRVCQGSGEQRPHKGEDGNEKTSFEFRVSGFGFRVQEEGVDNAKLPRARRQFHQRRGSGFEFGVWGLECRVEGLEFSGIARRGEGEEDGSVPEEVIL